MDAEKDFVKSRFIKPKEIEKRAFQAKLAESALKGGNSLVVAPTALGKTIVAVLVIAGILFGILRSPRDFCVSPDI